jgi:hypothetical protein
MKIFTFCLLSIVSWESNSASDRVDNFMLRMEIAEEKKRNKKRSLFHRGTKQKQDRQSKKYQDVKGREKSLNMDNTIISE